MKLDDTDWNEQATLKMDIEMQMEMEGAEVAGQLTERQAEEAGEEVAERRRWCGKSNWFIILFF
jgi:hypothetical protein